MSGASYKLNVLLVIIDSKPSLFLISTSFGASGGLCFAIVAFPGYLHIYIVVDTKLSLYDHACHLGDRKLVI